MGQYPTFLEPQLALALFALCFRQRLTGRGELGEEMAAMSSDLRRDTELAVAVG